MKARNAVSNIFTAIFVLFSAAGLLLYPKAASSAAVRGLLLCADTVIPSLFPFLVISGIAIESGAAVKLGRLASPVMKLFFNVNGACCAAFFLGLTGGYPVGARTAITLYKKGECSDREAERLLGFCNNSGPAFILGVAGAGIFGSLKVGVALYAVHIFSAVVTGLFFRGWKAKNRVALSHVVPGLGYAPAASVNFTEALTGCVKSAFMACINISAFVVFFSVAVGLLSEIDVISFLSVALARVLSPFGMDSAAARVLLTGAIEMTTGLGALSICGITGSAPFCLAAFIIGFGGLSVVFQTLSLLPKSGLSKTTCICGKLLHGVISAVSAFAVYGIFDIGADLPVFAEAGAVLNNAFMLRSILLSTLPASGALLWICLARNKRLKKL